MISIFYLCNGCGLYTSYAGKNEKQLNEVTVNLKNYLVMTSAFIMKEPEVKVHFCDKCYSQIMDGEIKVRSFGDIEVMRQKIESLEKDIAKKSEDYAEYKRRIQGLLGPINNAQ